MNKFIMILTIIDLILRIVEIYISIKKVDLKIYF